MARTRHHVHLKEPSIAGNFSLYLNGEQYGGSVSREGILQVLLSVIRNTHGKYQIIDKESEEVLLEYDTDQPVWDEVSVKDHSSKLMTTPQHEWQQETFYAGDDNDCRVMNRCFIGWHRGQSWNGWLDPWFTREQVDRIIRMVSEDNEYSEETRSGYRFTWIGDMLIVEDANLESVTSYESREIRPDMKSAPITVYNLFGSGYFTWSKV